MSRRRNPPDLYHHTTAEKAARIYREQRLRSAGEPDVYVTTADYDIGYGPVAVPIYVPAKMLQLDDEFPDGRKDYRIRTKGGSAPVYAGKPFPVRKPNPAGRRTMRISDLPDDVQEQLHNEVLHWAGPEGERRMLAYRYPVRHLPLTDVPDAALNDESDWEMARSMPDVSRMPPIIILNGRLYDGNHRVAAAHMQGKKTIAAIVLDDAGVVMRKFNPAGRLLQFPLREIRVEAFPSPLSNGWLLRLHINGQDVKDAVRDIKTGQARVFDSSAKAAAWWKKHGQAFVDAMGRAACVRTRKANPAWNMTRDERDVLHRVWTEVVVDGRHVDASTLTILKRLHRWGLLRASTGGWKSIPASYRISKRGQREIETEYYGPRRRRKGNPSEGERARELARELGISITKARRELSRRHRASESAGEKLARRIARETRQSSTEAATLAEVRAIIDELSSNGWATVHQSDSGSVYLRSPGGRVLRISDHFVPLAHARGAKRRGGADAELVWTGRRGAVTPAQLRAELATILAEWGETGGRRGNPEPGEPLVERLADRARALGLHIAYIDHAHTGSSYMQVRPSDDSDQYVVIRVSDHTPGRRPSGNWPRNSATHVYVKSWSPQSFRYAMDRLAEMANPKSKIQNPKSSSPFAAEVARLRSDPTLQSASMRQHLRNVAKAPGSGRPRGSAAAREWKEFAGYEPNHVEKIDGVALKGNLPGVRVDVLEGVGAKTGRRVKIDAGQKPLYLVWFKSGERFAVTGGPSAMRELARDFSRLNEPIYLTKVDYVAPRYPVPEGVRRTKANAELSIAFTHAVENPTLMTWNGKLDPKHARFDIRVKGRRRRWVNRSGLIF